MASLGIRPNNLERACRILEIAIELWQAGYTNESSAIDCHGIPVSPTHPSATAWRFDGALVAATDTQALIDGRYIEPASIDYTVSLFHPWCGCSMMDKAATKSRAETIDLAQRVIYMIKRDQAWQKGNALKLV